MTFSVEPAWNWPGTIVAILAILAVIWWTYPQRVKKLPLLWQRTLIGLRLFSAFLLLILLIRPVIIYEEDDQQRASLLVLFDKSRSMQTTDMPNRLSRREAAVKLWADQAPVLKDLSKDLDVSLLDFSQTLTPTETPDLVADGEMTAIGNAIEELREETRSGVIAGVILLSDGAQRAGGDLDIDPILAARRFLEEKGAPIHSVVMGTSEISTGGIDLALENLFLEQTVTFEKKTVPVQVKARVEGAAGKTVRIQLLLEDRTGKGSGQSGEMKPIPITQNSKPSIEIPIRDNVATLNVNLSFVAELAGEYKIGAEIVPDVGEVKLSNNRLDSLITVRKGGLRVAYFETPRIEQKFIRQLNDSANIQLDTHFIIPGRRTSAAVLDPKLFEPGVYDVYIIGDLPADVFQANGRNLLTLLADRLREGAGIGMIGGSRNLGAGGYASSPIAEFLPVSMTPGQKITLDQTPPVGVGHPVKFLPTRDGERQYLMQISALQSDQIWRQLPELSGANILVPKSGAVEILAESEQNEPLMIASDLGRTRALVIGIDETWKWHLQGFANEHQRFWQQVILWLARKEYESDQPVWVRVEPRNFPPFAKVPIEIGAQDEKGLPLPTAQFQAEIIHPDGKTSPLTVQRANEASLAEFTETGVPGDYWVRVSGTNNGQSLGISAMSRFVVDARDLELDNPAANPGLMSELAAMTGGNLLTPEALPEFLQNLLKEGIPSEFKRTHRVNLWDNWPILLLFISAMTTEWAVRKWKGLV